MGWGWGNDSGGKAVSKSRVSLSGDSLMWVNDITNPDGKSVQQTSTDTRVSGGSGFAGKWKSGDVKGSFDGKDNPVMQAGQASKFTNAFTKTGSNIKITTKLSGKVFAEDVYSISADGKTLTDDGTATATNEKTKSVFDRQ